MADKALHIAELIASHLLQEGTPSGRQELEAWRKASPANQTFLDEKVREDVLTEAWQAGYHIDKEDTWRKYEILKDQYLQSQHRAPVIRLYRRIAAAAVLIILTGIGINIWRNHFQQAEMTIATAAPVGLDPIIQRRLDLQGATVAAMDAGGRLVFTTDLLNYIGISDLLFRSAASSPKIAYNAVVVPYGSKYEVVLPDNTHVTVNAGSTLRFPVTFAGNERAVELTGEAFFDVQKGETHPFVVRTGQRSIEVLGTRFAVRNYSNEPLQTVILQTGKLKVHNGQLAALLQPGQEAQISDNHGIKVVQVNLDNALSWKDGYFNFDDLDLRAAVCQLAQWHGMKVRIEKDVKTRSLGVGNIAQGIALPKLLKLLELPDLHFEIHDSTIIVKR
jgi:transmembrane sensor